VRMQTKLHLVDRWHQVFTETRQNSV